MHIFNCSTRSGIFTPHYARQRDGGSAFACSRMSFF
jgi:hypothetical protein